MLLKTGQFEMKDSYREFAQKIGRDGRERLGWLEAKRKTKSLKMLKANQESPLESIEV